jgi:propanol-preferring alcohol dehydrogenase
LWLEKEIKTVANVTRRDLEEFLPLAAEARLEPEVQLYALEDANRALRDLKHGAVRGAKVLVIRGSGFSRDSSRDASEQSRLKPLPPIEV